MRFVLILLAVGLNLAFAGTPFESDWTELNLEGKVRVMVQVTREFADGVQTNEKRVVSYFDKRGYLQTRKHYFGGKLGWISSYEYDAQGRLAKSNDQNGVYKFKYKQDNDVLEQSKIYENTDAALNFRIITRYDAQGRIASQKELRGANMALLSSKAYEYDAQGELVYIKNELMPEYDVKFKLECKNGQLTRKCSNARYTKICENYDKKGLVLLRTEEIDGKFLETIRYENELDVHGNLTRRTSYRETGTKSEIVEIMEAKFEYFH